MITYQVESYADAFPEIEPYLVAHWHEVALHRDEIPLAMDKPAYQKLDAEGQLHILTVRADGKVVGYHVSLIRPHLHTPRRCTLSLMSIGWRLSFAGAAQASICSRKPSAR
jgi:hypothetical protein